MRPAPEHVQLSAIVPCFEEAATLPTLLPRIACAASALAPGAFEVVLVVSDHARDGTPTVAQALAEGAPWLRVVAEPPAAPGYGCAVAAGIRAARGETLWLIDGDGQFDPADLAAFAAGRAQDEVRIGWRSPRRDPWPRRLAGALYSRVSAALVGLPPVRDLDCAFKLIPGSLLAGVPLASRTGVVNAEILVAAQRRGATLSQRPVRHHPRAHGAPRHECRMGPLRHVPAPAEVRRILGDLARLLLRPRGPW